MGLRMKNFNMGVTKKSDFKKGGSQKNNTQGKLPKKGRLGQLADLRGVGFETPMHTMVTMMCAFFGFK